MLLFAGCNDNHITPRYDQHHEYTKFKYGEYTKVGVYIAKGIYVAKDKYIEYANDGAYVTEGEYGKYAKEDASIEDGHNKPLAKEGNDEPLAKNGNWAGCNNEPLVTKAIGHECRKRQWWAPCHKERLGYNPSSSQKCLSNCDETGVSATAIATNASVKDLCVIIEASNINKVAPRGN